MVPFGSCDQVLGDAMRASPSFLVVAPGQLALACQAFLSGVRKVKQVILQCNLAQEIQQGMGVGSWPPEEWMGKRILGRNLWMRGNPWFVWAALKGLGHLKGEGEGAGEKGFLARLWGMLKMLITKAIIYCLFAIYSTP